MNNADEQEQQSQQQPPQPQPPQPQPDQQQDRPANTGRTAGTAARAGGTGAQVAGKGTQLAGKGVQLAGKGIKGAGRAASAIPVVGPVLGGALTAAGTGAEMAGQGIETAGKGMNRAGQGASNIGKQLQKGTDALSGSKIDDALGVKKIFPILYSIPRLLRIVYILFFLPWALESLFSLLGAKRSITLFRKIPKTTVWEVVTSLTIFCIWFGTWMVIVVIFACINSKPWYIRYFKIAEFLTTGALNIDCGF